MATTTKLQLTFLDSEGTSITHSYNYADPEASTSSIQNFANVILTNKAVFTKQPQTLKSGKIVTTETTDIEFSA